VGAAGVGVAATKTVATARYWSRYYPLVPAVQAAKQIVEKVTA